MSLVTGVTKGMKILSNFNLILAAALLLFILIVGPTQFLLRDFVQSIGAYLQNVVGLSFNVTAQQGAAGEEWQGAWTTFYWGWWMSWAPFVGIFIARISKGRTVRQFVFGVLLVPTALTFLWFAVLGGAAIHQQTDGSGGLVGADGSVDVEGSLFALLGGLPAGTVLTFGAILLIGVFFVTSSDSGSLVMAMIASGGDIEPKNWLRVFFALVAALLAVALLLTGGLDALKTAAITTALPFSIVLLLDLLVDDHRLHPRTSGVRQGRARRPPRARRRVLRSRGRRPDPGRRHTTRPPLGGGQTPGPGWP